MRGRKPTPTGILKLRGSWRANRPDEPVADGVPKLPDYLQERAAKKFEEISGRLSRINVAGEIDTDAIARYCELFVWYRDLEKNKNTIYQGKMMIANLLIKIALLLGKLEGDLGLNPAARARLKVEKEEGKDEVQDLLRRVASAG